MADKLNEVEGLLNHFWLTACCEEQIKKATGIKYVSHLWDDYPYWYLWFTDLSGVYKLELHRAGLYQDYDWLAEFIVKYYPRPRENWFRGLAITEQLCRTSFVFNATPSSGGEGCPCCGGHMAEYSDAHGRFQDLADGTGVPAYRYAKEIPADYFFAGHVLLASKQMVGSVMQICSQTAWRVVMSEKCFAYDQYGRKLKVLDRGQTDRDFPGYEITHELGRRFYNGWTIFNNYHPPEKRIWKGAGIAFTSAGTDLTPIETSEIKKIVLDVIMKSHEADQLAPLDELLAGMTGEDLDD